MNCTGSINLIERLMDEDEIPASVDTIYTMSGRAGHKVAETLLLEGPHSVEPGMVYLGKTDEVVPASKLPESIDPTADPLKWVVITESMIEDARGYVDYINGFRGQSVEYYFGVENRLDGSEWVDGGFGTVDMLLLVGDTLHVIDYKTGQMKVEVAHNPQLMFYGLMAYGLLEMLFLIKKVVLHIYQPPLDEPASSFEVSPEALLDWGELLRAKAAETYEADAPLTPGDTQCRWCPAKAHCPALAEQSIRTAFNEFSGFASTPDQCRSVDTLSDADVGYLLDRLPLIEQWVKAVRDRAFNTLELNGNTGIPGYKLVAGRSLRKWAGDDAMYAAAELMAAHGIPEESIFKKQMISPAQAEKVLGKKNSVLIAKHIEKPEGKPTLAPVNDPRAPLKLSTAHDDFADAV